MLITGMQFELKSDMTLPTPHGKIRQNFTTARDAKTTRYRPYNHRWTDVTDDARCDAEGHLRGFIFAARSASDRDSIRSSKLGTTFDLCLSDAHREYFGVNQIEFIPEPSLNPDMQPNKGNPKETRERSP